VQPVGRTQSRSAHDRAPVAVTIHGAEWPFAVRLLRGNIAVDHVDGIAPEYRASATRYFGAEQGEAWCASLPGDIEMERVRLEPSWVGLLDFDGMRPVAQRHRRLTPTERSSDATVRPTRSLRGGPGREPAR
jgi:hypothetical protein